jgi:hypothetical protein
LPAALAVIGTLPLNELPSVSVIAIGRMFPSNGAWTGWPGGLIRLAMTVIHESAVDCET